MTLRQYWQLTPAEQQQWRDRKAPSLMTSSQVYTSAAIVRSYSDLHRFSGWPRCYGWLELNRRLGTCCRSKSLLWLKWLVTALPLIGCAKAGTAPERFSSEFIEQTKQLFSPVVSSNESESSGEDNGESYVENNGKNNGNLSKEYRSPTAPTILRDDRPLWRVALHHQHVTKSDVLATRTRRWRSESRMNKPSGLMDWEALTEFCS